MPSLTRMASTTSSLLPGGTISRAGIAGHEAENEEGDAGDAEDHEQRLRAATEQEAQRAPAPPSLVTDPARAPASSTQVISTGQKSCTAVG